MPYKKTPLLWSSVGLMLLVVAAVFWLVPAQPAAAQCGSQASSCKNCHEVQGELPVNSDGAGWHESHAFGDFCTICHAGNQQATDIEAAHTGMVDPLSDVNASCQMCHADDLNERAQVYADTLGIDLASNSGDSGLVAPASDAPDDTAADDPAQAAVEQITATSLTDSELIVDDPNVIDYAARYDEIVLGKHPTNWGNVVLSALIGLMLVGGGGFVVYNERRLHKPSGTAQVLEGVYPADVVDMLPALARLKIQTRQALKKLLDHPSKAEKVLGLIDTVASDKGEE